ncbi:hypothetical protein [Sulfurimonas sp.]
MGYKIRGNKLYVHGTVDGKFYRLSTGKEATPLNEKWIAKNHRDVLLKLIAEDKCQVQSKNVPQRRTNMYQLATKKVAPMVKEFLPFVFV